MEGIQRSFTYYIDGTKGLNYYERLKYLKLYSLQRRAERFMIIHAWKIMEGLVVNLSINPVLAVEHDRLGRKIKIPPLCKKAGTFQTVQYNSFVFRAGRLFNCLPVGIRNLHGVGVDSFKRSLDGFLLTLPDEPGVDGYVKWRVASSNSITDQWWALRAGQQN